MTEIYSDEISYTNKISNHSTPMYRTVTPQSGQTVTLSETSSVGPVDIVISPAVINYSKSRLSFTLSLPESNTAARFTYLNANFGNLFSRIVLSDTVTSAVIADISNFDYYMSLVSPAGTHFDDLVTKPITAVQTFATAATSNLYPVEEITRTRGDAVNNFTGNAAVDIGTLGAYTGRRQQYISVVSAGGNEGLMVFNVSIPLSAFKMSFFSVNKNIYVPSNLNLSLYFNAIQSYAFVGSSATTATTNAAVYVPLAGQTPQITNLSLVTCNEGNLSLSSQLIQKVMSEGISMPYSYPTISRYSAGATSSHSINLMLSRAYGSRILAIVTAGFETVNSNPKVHVRGDLAQINTFLNNVAILSQSGFNCLRGEDYSIANAHFIEKSCIPNNAVYALADWVHCDSWMGQIPLWEMDKKQTDVDGMDVSAQNSTWSLIASSTGNRTFTFISAIFGQKVVSFSSSGTLVM
jgi:hypothetical protein